MTFTVLFVCTGNICRSPVAELLARAALERLGATGVTVASAGTWGHDGSAMEPEALAALAELAIDGRGFRARELTAEMVADADLVLGLAHEHAAAAVAAEPSAAGRVFSLTEFARLVAGLRTATDGGRSLVAAAAAARRIGEIVVDEDVRDPYGAPAHVFASIARDIARLVDLVVPALVGAPMRSASAGMGILAP